MLLHGFGGCAGRRTYKASNDGKGCDESSTAPPCTGYKLFVANDKLNVWISFFSFFMQFKKDELVCFRWIEMMAPVFSKAAWRCVWYMIQVHHSVPLMLFQSIAL